MLIEKLEDGESLSVVCDLPRCGCWIASHGLPLAPQSPLRPLPVGLWATQLWVVVWSSDSYLPLGLMQLSDFKLLLLSLKLKPIDLKQQLSVLWVKLRWMWESEKRQSVTYFYPSVRLIEHINIKLMHLRVKFIHLERKFRNLLKPWEETTSNVTRYLEVGLIQAFLTLNEFIGFAKNQVSPATNELAKWPQERRCVLWCSEYRYRLVVEVPLGGPLGQHIVRLCRQTHPGGWKWLEGSQEQRSFQICGTISEPQKRFRTDSTTYWCLVMVNKELMQAWCRSVKVFKCVEWSKHDDE